MARDETPDFGRGETMFGGTPTATQITESAHFEGQEKVFEDVNWSNSALGAKQLRSGRSVTCRCVRNTSGGNLLPKRLVTFEADSSADDYGKRVDGYSDVTAERAYPVDEFLPAAGVENNDLFWIVVKGPAEVLTDIAAAAGNVINVGDRVVALTAVTSGATTAGRVRNYPTVAAATNTTTGIDAALLEAQNNLAGVLGRALTAKTTGNTNSAILIDVGKW